MKTRNKIILIILSVIGVLIIIAGLAINFIFPDVVEYNFNYYLHTKKIVKLDEEFSLKQGQIAELEGTDFSFRFKDYYRYKMFTQSRMDNMTVVDDRSSEIFNYNLIEEESSEQNNWPLCKEHNWTYEFLMNNNKDEDYDSEDFPYYIQELGRDKNNQYKFKIINLNCLQ